MAVNSFNPRTSHKPIRIYMGVLMLDIVHGFCFFRLIFMGGKELKCSSEHYVFMFHCADILVTAFMLSGFFTTGTLLQMVKSVRLDKPHDA